MPYSRTYAEQLAEVTGAPWWITQSVAGLEPVSEGTWYDGEQVTWHAERNRISLIITRTARWDVIPGPGGALPELSDQSEDS